MTLICNLKTDLIMSEPHNIKLIFLLTLFIVELFDFFTFHIMHIIGYLGHFFNFLDILHMYDLLNHFSPTKGYFSTFELRSYTTIWVSISFFFQFSRILFVYFALFIRSWYLSLIVSKIYKIDIHKLNSRPWGPLYLLLFCSAQDIDKKYVNMYMCGLSE